MVAYMSVKKTYYKNLDVLWGHMGETIEDINLKNKRDTMYDKYSIPF